MRAEILSIGDELLDGRVADTNASVAAGILTRWGMQVSRISVVGDRPDDIAQAINASVGPPNRLVIVSGGLGPTEDDVTARSAADGLGVRIHRDEEAERWVRAWFTARGRPMAQRNLKQADLPEGSRPVPNPLGTAPGFVFERGGCTALFVPGVPREASAMLAETLPALLPQARPTPRRTLMVFGQGESDASELLAPLAEANARVRMHYRVCFPTLEIQMEAEDETVLDLFHQEARNLLGKYVYATEPIGLAEALGRRLQAAGQTLALAESCTGGLAGHLVTTVPGSSAYFAMSVVAYGNAAKQSVLGVPSDVIETHGAVSAETARAMAEGARSISGSDWSAAITGIAGPDGGTEEKPVGLVHLAVAGPDGTTAHERVFVGFSRQRVQQLAAHTALALLLRRLDRLAFSDRIG